MHAHICYEKTRFLKLSACGRTHASARTRTRTYYIGTEKLRFRAVILLLRAVILFFRASRTCRAYTCEKSRNSPVIARERPLQAFRASRGIEVPSAPQNSAESILVDSEAFHETV